MYSLGNPDGVGPFFPNGLVGAINKPTGYTNMASGLEDFPSEPYLANQVQRGSTLHSCACMHCICALPEHTVVGVSSPVLLCPKAAAMLLMTCCDRPCGIDEMALPMLT